MAMGLEYEVGTIGTDIIMLQEDIKMVSQQNSKYFFVSSVKVIFYDIKPAKRRGKGTNEERRLLGCSERGLDKS